jgi:acyl-CoA thioesterase YciA
LAAGGLGNPDHAPVCSRWRLAVKAAEIVNPRRYTPGNHEEDDMDSRQQPKSRVLMMPRDTNPGGTIFGGVILSYMDQAGAEEAVCHGARRVVTVAMQEVVFHEPVFVGDLVSFYTELKRVGRTSITVTVNVIAARRWNREETVRVTGAEITYVNVNDSLRPTLIAEDQSGE